MEYQRSRLQYVINPTERRGIGAYGIRVILF